VRKEEERWRRRRRRRRRKRDKKRMREVDAKGKRETREKRRKGRKERNTTTHTQPARCSDATRAQKVERVGIQTLTRRDTEREETAVPAETQSAPDVVSLSDSCDQS
jgi:hypothetical protein